MRILSKEEGDALEQRFKAFNLSWLRFNRRLCVIGLHDYVPQLHSYDDDVVAIRSTGEPLPIYAYCGNCGKKRGPL